MFEHIDELVLCEERESGKKRYKDTVVMYISYLFCVVSDDVLCEIDDCFLKRNSHLRKFHTFRHFCLCELL